MSTETPEQFPYDAKSKEVAISIRNFIRNLTSVGCVCLDFIVYFQNTEQGTTLGYGQHLSTTV